jgi:predicted deacylase
VKILSGSELSRRRLPYMRMTAPRPGPTIWLTGCSHGDEVGGIVVIQEVFRRLRRQPLRRGSVHAFPLMNPFGFEAAVRHLTFSEEDLNRAFPGNATGTLAERLAERIFTTIAASRPAAVIDLHNDWIRSIPYAVLDAPPAKDRKGAYRRSHVLATRSGLPAVVETNPLRRTLSHALIEHGIPALTLELGESHVVNETNVTLGMRSVFNQLAALHMLDSEEEELRLPLANDVPRKVLEYSQLPLSSSNGIIRFLVRPAEVVAAGQPVARITNSFGSLVEKLSAPGRAVVLGLADSSVAYPGAPVMASGRF